MNAKAHYRIALAFLAGMIGVLASGCRHRPSYQSFGAQVIEVNHGSAQAASAVYATHSEMNGAPFSERGRNWTSDGVFDSSIAETTFRLPGGAECVITRITVNGRPLLVFLKSDDDKSCMELHNAFTRNLVKHGVEPRQTWHNLGASNRSQRVAPETNRTSSAAVSGR